MIRVRINDVSFYTTKKRIREGVGDSTEINAIVSLAYKMLKNHNGCTTISVYDNKMIKKTYNVQIG